nr:hypothetical protein [Tanacetum cinerariifolium]
VLGDCISAMYLVFAGLARMPSKVTIYPKNFPSVTSNEHFFGFNFMLILLRLSNVSAMSASFPLLVFLFTTISSTYTLRFFLIWDWNASPTNRWKKSVKKLVERRVAKAIGEYEKTRADSINAGGSGSASTRGSADVQGCSYKTFMNCKPHSFNGTEGVVELKCWFEKMEQVFEIFKCTEDDKVKFAMCTLEGRALTWKKIEKYVRGFPERIKGNITSSKLATLHDAINMARELVEQAVQAPAEGIYAGNLPRCNRCNSHHNGQCPPKCRKCQRTGHQEKDCRVRPLQDMTCYGCGEKGHFKGKYLKGRNQQNEGARGRAYVVVENPQQNPNVVAGSFDVIIVMDWLSYHRAVIDCYEKIVRIPLPNGEI